MGFSVREKCSWLGLEPWCFAQHFSLWPVECQTWNPGAQGQGRVQEECTGSGRSELQPHCPNPVFPNVHLGYPERMPGPELHQGSSHTDGCPGLGYTDGEEDPGFQQLGWQGPRSPCSVARGGSG